MLQRGILQGKLSDQNKPIGHVSSVDDTMEIVGYERVRNPFKKYGQWVEFLGELGVNTNRKNLANNARTNRPFIPESVPRMVDTELLLSAAREELLRRFNIKLDLREIFTPER